MKQVCPALHFDQMWNRTLDETLKEVKSGDELIVASLVIKNKAEAVLSVMRPKDNITVTISIEEVMALRKSRHYCVDVERLAKRYGTPGAVPGTRTFITE